LLTYEDFAAKPSDPAFKSVAELCRSRMKSTTQPMPPTQSVDAASIAVFSRWISQGLPRGTCGEDTPDGGADDASVDDPDSGDTPDPPAPVSVCTSDVFYDGTTHTEKMEPGNKCISCHSDQEGPAFEIAGTVYPTLHEPVDCNGSDEASVVIIDAAGFVHTLQTNAAGNFFMEDSFPRPYRALVVRHGNLKEMQTPQTNGDCNSCHTEWGSQGAPGRINIP
jgi:hypothetical protein